MLNKKSSTEKYSDEAVIATKVKAALFGNMDLAATEINAETDNGEEQLNCLVSTKSQIEATA